MVTPTVTSFSLSPFFARALSFCFSLALLSHVYTSRICTCNMDARDQEYTVYYTQVMWTPVSCEVLPAGHHTHEVLPVLP
jgi:hypothetical protein